MCKFYNEIISPILANIERFSDRNAFCIADIFYTYQNFGQAISKIRKAIEKTQIGSPIVGLVINDDLETYASIVALWLEGKCYVPLHPNWPLERCLDICEQVELDLILDSSDKTRYDGFRVIATSALEYSEDFLTPKQDVSDNELAYILFTSGSTGKPKGVPISRGNVAAFVSAFFEIGFEITEEDKVLQCFDLTFDLSVMSYLVPLLKGACIYTVSDEGAKYMQVSALLDDYQLTVALMAPSIITYLRPYFDEIDLPAMRYSLFCGEALREDVTSEWADCLPNAEIYNVYGPTEDTIFCTYYKFNRDGANKNHNGVLSIGKAMTSGKVDVFGEDGRRTSAGELGELCLAGNQLFLGYWKNEAKTKESFFITPDGTRYYKSGDLCYYDEEGDIMYSGRIDHQAKIQGFRVELGEIEFHAREFLKDKNVVCLAFDNDKGLTEIAMFIESDEFAMDDMTAYMRTKMPSYMIPTRILFIPVFPLNSNDKIDKKQLKKML